MWNEHAELKQKLEDIKKYLGEDFKKEFKFEEQKKIEEGMGKKRN